MDIEVIEEQRNSVPKEVAQMSQVVIPARDELLLVWMLSAWVQFRQTDNCASNILSMEERGEKGKCIRSMALRRAETVSVHRERILVSLI